MWPQRGSLRTRWLPAERTPDARAYVRTMLASKIKAGLEEAMAAQLNGSRSVRLQVRVKEFVISTAGEQILVGRDHDMTAAVELVDARTGATIIFQSQRARLPAREKRTDCHGGECCDHGHDPARDDKKDAICRFFEFPLRIGIKRSAKKA